MKLKISLIIFIIVSVGLWAVSVFFFIKNENLKVQLTQVKKVFQEAQEDLSQLRKERRGLLHEKERMQAESVSAIMINTKLQSEKKRLENSMQYLKEKINRSEKLLKESKQNLDRLRLELDDEKTVRKSELFEKSKKLQGEISSLENRIEKERSVYYYNLAVAYTRAKFYDEAIRAYEKSFKLTSTDPDACYNLGLLYENVKEDSEKAIFYYKKYLKLKPDARDKKEVELWIYNLTLPSLVGNE